MGYKDDVKKLQEEAGITEANPVYAKTGSQREDAIPGARPAAQASSEDNPEDVAPGSTFTSAEKKMSVWQRISLPFIRSSFLSALFFLLVTLVWIAISDTIVANIMGIGTKTLHIFFIKDFLFAIILSIILYRLFCSQFANSYHMVQAKEKSENQAKYWETIEKSMIETVPDMIVYTLDTELRYTSFNKRAKYSSLRLWKKEIQVGDSILDVVTDPDIKAQLKEYLEQALSGEYHSHIEKYGDNDQTASYWQTYFAPLLDEDKKIMGVSCFINNITALKQAQSKNLFLSYHDPLTKLFNRVYVEDVFEQAEREARCPYSIIVADIKGMHQINENYGRSTGDSLLCKVAEIISKAIKDNGIVARWGSDEFIVLLPDTEKEKAEAFMNICKCQFPGVTVNGIPLRVLTGFATRTEPTVSLQDTVRSAEIHSEQSNLEI